MSEVLTFLQGFEPLISEEAVWSAQSEKTQQGIAMAAKWAVRHTLAATLRYWLRSEPLPSECLLDQAERLKLHLGPDEKRCLKEIDTKIGVGFEILSAPYRSVLARNAFLMASGIHARITQSTHLARLRSEIKKPVARPDNRESGATAGDTMTGEKGATGES